MAFLYYPLNGSNLGRVAQKNICRAWSCLHYLFVGSITVERWLQILVQIATDNLLVALEDQAIARPVIGINTCCANVQQIVDERLLPIVGGLGIGDILKRSDRPH